MSVLKLRFMLAAGTLSSLKERMRASAAVQGLQGYVFKIFRASDSARLRVGKRHIEVDPFAFQLGFPRGGSER